MNIFRDLLTAVRGPAARRRQLNSGTQIENLELRQMLSASGGGHRAAAEIAQARAVPRIDVAGNDYEFSDGIGGMVITQNGLSIHGVITRPNDSPNGTFDAAFKTDKSKVAKGTGSLILEGDETETPVKFKIKFKIFKDGGVGFHYHYSINRNAD